MATYVNDLRLTELATGEGSGTWGTTTNQSLELIGEALGYATQQAFGSDADATTTVADGASDPARAMYYKITSAASLTATRTLTIAPNTISRVMFIENATSGSQSIAISQGSGASVTIATGKTAVVYLDGAGATAAVVDAMAGVDPGVTDTLTEVLVAGNTSGGTNIELSTTDKVQFRDAAIYINSSVDGQLDIVADTEIQIAATTVDLNGNLDVSGTALVTGVLTTTAATVFNGGFASNADSTLGTDKKVQFRDSAIYINSSVDGQLDIVADTEIQIAATTVDLNGNLDVSGTLGVTGVATLASLVATTADINAGTIDNTVIGGTTAAAGTFTTVTASGDVTLSGGTANGVAFANGSKVLTTGSALTFDGTNTVTLNASAANLTLGISTNYGLVTATGTNPASIYFNGGSRTGFESHLQYFGANHVFFNETGGSEIMRLLNTGNVGIGTSSPSSYDFNDPAKLVVANTSGNSTITIASGASNIGYLAFADGTTGTSRYSGSVQYNHSTNALSMHTTDGTERLTIASTGAATFGGSVALAGSSGGLLLNDSATADNTIQLNTTGGTTFVGSNGSAGNRFLGSSAYASTFGTTAANALELATNNTVRMTIASTGAATFSGTVTATGGVVFGDAGGSGTPASNTLDSYEEGTWTPALANIGTGTYTHQVGRYTKIGNLVTASVHIDINVLGTASGSVDITNLPFTASAVSNNYGSASSIHAQNFTTAAEGLNVLINPNTAVANVFSGSGATSAAVNLTHAVMGTGNLLCTLVYFTA
jgi:hypothetical protein